MTAEDLMFRLHVSNKRQGPGSDKITALALDIACLDGNKAMKMADIGCGTGSSALMLAERFAGELTAVDIFPGCLEKLEKNAADRRLKAKIIPLCASMDALPFGKQEYDLIWSEGAVYNIGFRNGVRQWREFLKPGGILGVSEIVWTTPSRPSETEEYWTSQYPEISTVAEKMDALCDAGYGVLGHVILPKDCWLDNYYEPLLRSHEPFVRQYGEFPEAKAIVEANEREYGEYLKYGNYYSYAFFICRA